jgi:hypothetical protein
MTNVNRSEPFIIQRLPDDATATEPHSPRRSWSATASVPERPRGPAELPRAKLAARHHFPSEALVRKKAAERGGQLSWIGGFERQCRAANDLTQGRRVGNDDRRGQRHRFDSRQAEALDD